MIQFIITLYIEYQLVYAIYDDSVAKSREQPWFSLLLWLRCIYLFFLIIEYWFTNLKQKLLMYTLYIINASPFFYIYTHFLSRSITYIHWYCRMLTYYICSWPKLLFCSFSENSYFFMQLHKLWIANFMHVDRNLERQRSVRHLKIHISKHSFV